MLRKFARRARGRRPPPRAWFPPSSADRTHRLSCSRTIRISAARFSAGRPARTNRPRSRASTRAAATRPTRRPTPVGPALPDGAEPDLKDVAAAKLRADVESACSAAQQSWVSCPVSTSYKNPPTRNRERYGHERTRWTSARRVASWSSVTRKARLRVSDHRLRPARRGYRPRRLTPCGTSCGPPPSRDRPRGGTTRVQAYGAHRR